MILPTGHICPKCQTNMTVMTRPKSHAVIVCQRCGYELPQQTRKTHKNVSPSIEGIRCPKCGNAACVLTKDGKSYRCRKCRKQFLKY